MQQQSSTASWDACILHGYLTIRPHTNPKPQSRMGLRDLRGTYATPEVMVPWDKHAWQLVGSRLNP